jgi:putative spermidine/putrescine transport system ATP-binding protein
MPEPALELQGLEKYFGTHRAVANIDLTVQQGEFVTLLGPSGCGKTTTLNMIAGFLAPDAGAIRLNGRPVHDLPAHKRDLGLVFQDYALFPHRTCAENIAFGLRMRRMPRSRIAQLVQEALAMVRLDGFGDRRPAQLSGGQRQRVALARALVIRPALLLLDEPLSNLDLKLREEMRVEISSLQRRLGIATVFVTHDQDEALTMSDRIAVMRDGRIEQIGTARDIYERPASEFVATFIGTMNMLRSDVLGQSKYSVQPVTEALLTIRPERLNLTEPDTAPQGAIVWPCSVERVTYLGSRLEVALRLRDGSPVTAHLVNTGRDPWRTGDAVDAWFRPEDAWTIPVGTVPIGERPA